MRRALPLLFLLLVPHLTQGADPKPVASYDIRATLDPAAKTIRGTQVLTWLNDSPDTVATLQFHLYLNAFKNEKSTFLRGRSSPPPRDWGWIDVTRLRLAGGEDLTARLRFIQPDDANADDQTVAEVALPSPVPPGATLRVEIDFLAKLPRVVARTGYHGSFFLAGQWFPKLGVWETRGFRGRADAGWNCHQFHPNSEFYANFGDYRVTLTVPRDSVVGATGQQRSRVVDEKSRTATWVFEQPMVTDFAFAVQPTFVRLEREFDPSRDVPSAERAAVARMLGIPEAQLALPRTRMILLLQPEHRAQAERHFRALVAGLKGYGLWLGPYPHPTITLVDPPHGATAAGGMEYPAFITGGTRWREPASNNFMDETIVHEFGHQYFKELIATNEFEEPWLDEGFTHYTTTRIMEREYEPSRPSFTVLGLDLSKWLRLPVQRHWSTNRRQFLSAPATDDLQRSSWGYLDSASYGVNAYPRAAITLRTLENLLGEAVMARVLRTYFERWRFAHPATRDFQAIAEEVSGRPLGWFFDQFVFGSRVLDYRVGSVESRRREEPLGVFDGPPGQPRTTRRVRRDDGKPPVYESSVTIHRAGDAVAPIRILIRFDDGHTEERQWDGQYRWVRFTFLRPHQIAWVHADPERHYELDIRLANNSWQRERQDKAIVHWGGTLVFWLQNALVWMGALI